MRIMIAGGGTGGHLFPALAIAQAFTELEPGVEICFVNGGSQLDKKVLSNSGYEFKIIAARPFRGRGPVQKTAALFAVLKGIKTSLRLIKEFKPQLVLAVGGYGALPLGLAARIKKIPLCVQEQNATLGMVNNILSKFAQKIFLGFPGPEKKIGVEKCVYTGNPVREDILRQAANTARDDKLFTVLVWGGSQGARSINNAVIEALPFITRPREELYFIHQTGPGQVEEIEDAYRANGIKARVSPFFENPGQCYAMSHAIICRAGAGSLSEMMALGRSGLCVPYPYAAGDHQAHNARVLVNTGAMECVLDADLNGLVAAEFIDRLRSNHALREKREEAARAWGRPGAARDIVLACKQMLEL